MVRPRILLAVGPPLLRDAFHTLLAQDGQFLVMDEQPRDVDILVRARRQRVEVVVATFERISDVPPLLRQLWAEFPEIRVVALALPEQCTRIYRHGEEVRTIADFTASGILRSIVDEASLSGETGGD